MLLLNWTDAAIHSYAVTATYNCGQSTPGASASGYALQVPSVPIGVSASGGTYCGTVQVAWTASSGAASYNVYRDGILAGNVVASLYTDTPGDSANHDYMYDYRILAVLVLLNWCSGRA